MREMLDAWIDANRDLIISETQKIVRIPSVEEKTTVGPGAPFGLPLSAALTHTLALCERLGMEAQNFEGFAGHADFGSGDEIVAMLGHLDVVPVGKDWTKDPFGGEVSGGYLWSRGAADDKGPTYAALFAAKAVLDVTQSAGVSLRRKIRLIFGCDEESGWQCMAHYFGAAGQPKPTLGFTPDAAFPLVHAEKGSFTAVAQRVIPKSNAPLHVAVFASGLRPNMVPDQALAVLEGDSDALDLAMQVLADMPDISVERHHDDRQLNVIAKGRSAHGAAPQKGDNAAIKLLRALSSSGSALDDLDAADHAWMADIARRGDVLGANNDISGSDDITGALSSNLGIVSFDGMIVEATFNVRYPASWDGEALLTRFKESLRSTGWDIASLSHTPPLYVPLDEEPVKTLLRVYREQTGDMTPPLTMGGRTYATTIAPVGVAFGPSREGDSEGAHEADEHILVERLIESAKIYAQAFYELAR